LQAEQEQSGGQVDPIQEAVVADAVSQIESRENQDQLDFAKLQEDMQKNQQEFFVKQEELELKRQEQERKNFETMTKALADIREGFGVDTIVGPPTVPAMDNQARLVLDLQNQVSNDLPTSSDDIPEPSVI